MRFYFMGIAGSAMGNIALLMQSLGHEVIGTDQSIYPPMSHLLENARITVFQGYNAARLESLKVDCVVVGNVVSRGNVEIEWLLETKTYPYLSMAELIKTHILKNRNNIVITGTHGKTTTSMLTAYLLKQNGLNPGYLMGGVPRDLPSGAELGNPQDPFVIEGDEYDTAFFDKRSKFVHYLPSILVVNNIECDHVDIFRDLEDVKRAFSQVIRLVPRNGAIIMNGDDTIVRSLTYIHWTKVYSVGLGQENDFRIQNFKEDVQGSAFDLFWHGKLWTRIQSSLSGLFNARNMAMAAVAASLSQRLFHREKRKLNQVDDASQCAIDVHALKIVQGVKRRQEVLFSNKNLVVIEDFGHHPTALRAFIMGLRSRYSAHCIALCFEPRSNTSCTNLHHKELKEAFLLADRIFLGPVYRAEKYSDAERLNTVALANEINAAFAIGSSSEIDSSSEFFSTGNSREKIIAKAFDSHDALLRDLWNFIEGQKESQKVIGFVSNGDFGGIINTFVENLKAS